MRKKIDSISVIVPVFNEEDAVKKVIKDIIRVMGGVSINFEIIAVNDGSTDKSEQILSAMDGISIIKHAQNRGYGASLKTGIKNAQYDWIIIIDADNTYPAEAIPDLVSFAGRYDLIIGARNKGSYAIPYERRTAKIFLNRLASYLAGRKIPDLNSGMRVFRKELARKFWMLFPDGFSFTSTLTMACLTRGYETKFFPIKYRKRMGSSSIKSMDFFSFCKLVVKLSLFFKPIKLFSVLSLFIASVAAVILLSYFFGYSDKFHDTIFIVLMVTALQTFFFGLLAEIIIHSQGI